MTSLTKALTNAAALMAVVMAVTGCGRRDGSDTTAAASPGAGTYSPAPGAEGGVGTFTDSTEVTVDVIGVDEDARTITVTEAESGTTVPRPGTETDADTETGTNPGARGTAGAIASRRTLTVDTSAAEQLSRVKAGDRVRLTCSHTMGAMGGTAGTMGTTGTGTTGTGTTGTGMGMMSGTTGSLANCTTVAAILPETGSNARGR